MQKIPTAEEFLEQQYKDLNIKWKDGELKSWRDEDITILINFAKLHVEAALKEAAETNYPSTKANFELVNSKILNAYPLTNIK